MFRNIGRVLETSPVKERLVFAQRLTGLYRTSSILARGWALMVLSVLCALCCGLMACGWQISLAREGAAQNAAHCATVLCHKRVVDKFGARGPMP